MLDKVCFYSHMEPKVQLYFLSSSENSSNLSVSLPYLSVREKNNTFQLTNFFFIYSQSSSSHVPTLATSHRSRPGFHERFEDFMCRKKSSVMRILRSFWAIIAFRGAGRLLWVTFIRFFFYIDLTCVIFFSKKKEQGNDEAQGINET